MGNFRKVLLLGLLASPTWATYTEPYRPQYHFSPAKNWMNDPTGLLYYNEIYHLFFQYNPGGIEWGNMSWGHATSKDLSHWEEQPIALLARGFPDNITEMFFTGSAVADVNNTSGLGTDGKIPLVALYTSLYPVTQTLRSGKTVKANQQSQSLAYSLDDGLTWQTDDSTNPVIHYPPTPYEDQYQNFRDPFIFWHEQTHKWVLVTALSEIHKLIIWTSDNLRNWSVVSEFGPSNAVGGVWECPNLFPLPLDGSQTDTKWVMVVGLNPGGPPETVGSGTQYFVGGFNGTTFIPDDDNVYPANGTANWMDWGPDFYAAASYNGLPDIEHVSIGWMNNWQYGGNIPTYPWRSAMATPRYLSLRTIRGKVTLVQQPREDWASIESQKKYSRSWKRIAEGMEDLGSRGKTLDIELSFDGRPKRSGASEFGIIVQATADKKQQTRVGYDFKTQKVFLDRTQSGDVSFDETFARVYHAPLEPGTDGVVRLRILVDWSSVEVFGGQGERTMTAQIFPSAEARYATLFSSGGSTEHVHLSIADVSSIWQ